MKVSAKLLILLLPVFALAQNTPPGKLEDSLKAANTDSLRHAIVVKLAGYYAEGNRDLCLKYADIDINLAKRNGKALDLASALDQKGYELTHERKFTEALSCFDEAKTLAEDPANGNNYWRSDSYPPHINVRLEVLASIYHDLGHLMGATGDMEQKIACYRRAIAIDRQGGSGAIIPYADMNLGSSYLRLGRLDSALILSNKAASLFEKGNDKAYLGLVYLNIGHIYNKKNEREPELLYYHKAEATNFAQHNLTTLAEAYLSLSKFYADLKRPDSALFYAKKMMTVARSISVSDFSNAYEVLVACYKLNHQPDSVTKYLGLALAAKDSSYDATVKSLADFQKLSFKTQNRLNALEKEKELSRSRNRMYVLLSAIAVLLILALIFYRNNRQKQKANLLLSEQKEEIAAQRDELESKNTELEIAAALERVRAVAMSMNKPEDLLNISKALFAELTALHFSEMRNALIQTYFDEIRCFGDYDYSDFSGGHINRIPYKQNSIVDKFLNEIRESKDAFSEIAITGDNMKKWIEFRASNNETPDERLNHSSSLYYYFYSVGGAAIGISTFAPITPEKLNIVKRFRNVFDLAYKRYVDITKAEAQAREARIEAALEKVRSRSLAMYQTEELGEVVNTVFEKLRDLGVNTESDATSIMLFEEGSRDFVQWIAIPGQVNVKSFRIGYIDHPIPNDFFEARERGADFFSKSFPFEVKNPYWTRVFRESDFKNLPEELKQVVLQGEGYSYSVAMGRYSGICIPNFKGNLLSEAENDILKRFARVFEQAYIRFLDLQTAEMNAIQKAEDLKKLQEEKKRTEDALTELRATQTQLIQSEKMASLGELTAGIAHEIQNPLNFVNNFSEVSVELLAELKEEEEKGNKEDVMAIANDLIQNLEKIRHHGKRADAIVKGMLQHSRRNSGQKEPTDLNALADEYMRLSYHGLRAKDKSFNADMVAHFDPNLPKVNVMAQDIGRVLLNLFNNAFYAVNQKQKTAGNAYKPEVSVSTSSENGQVVIKVRDNGTGIPDAIKDKIMQPFFTTKPTGEGTGLGLSLTYDMVVKGHGGAIQVNSVEGEGSEFTVILPVN